MVSSFHGHQCDLPQLRCRFPQSLAGVNLRGARLDYAEKRFKNAWQICESILVLAPQVPFRDEVRKLRRAAQGRYIARSVVVVSFEPATDLAFPIAEFSGNVREHGL